MDDMDWMDSMGAAVRSVATLRLGPNQLQVRP